MATEKHGILGQVSPAANTDATIYGPVPAGRKATISTLAIANTNATGTNYRVNARINGAAIAVANQIAPDVPINPNDTTGITWGITLGPGDILSGRSGAGAVNFTAFGVEEDLV